MKSKISEFSYGYTVTEEIVTSLKASVVAAPFFPSLYEEGKVGGGYDVKIESGIPIFLQFKLSDYLERPNSKEHRDGHIGIPYYRMHLRSKRNSEQHTLLLDLEAKGESVFYIAPEFHQTSELNDFYLRKSIISNSAAFSPKDIGDIPDDEEHYVVFERGSSHGFFCSNHPVKIRKASLKDGIIKLLQSHNAAIKKLDEPEFRNIADKMIDVLSAAEKRLKLTKDYIDIDGIRRITSNRTPIASIGYMARTFFDAEFLIIPNQP
jgi:hypothetical protein